MTSSMQKGEIGFVELKSKAGEKCLLRNPWGETEVSLFRNGKKKEQLSGSLLQFDTKKEETIVVVPANVSPDQLKRTVLGM